MNKDRLAAHVEDVLNYGFITPCGAKRNKKLCAGCSDCETRPVNTDGFVNKCYYAEKGQRVMIQMARMLGMKIKRIKMKNP